MKERATASVGSSIIKLNIVNNHLLSKPFPIIPLIPENIRENNKPAIQTTNDKYKKVKNESKSTIKKV